VIQRRIVPSDSTSARGRDLAEIVAVTDVGIKERTFRESGLEGRRDLDWDIDIFVHPAGHERNGEPLSRMVISDFGNRIRWHDR